MPGKTLLNVSISVMLESGLEDNKLRLYSLRKARGRFEAGMFFKLMLRLSNRLVGIELIIV